MAAHQAPLPWDSPGKNTGVGCHFLLQYMKVKSESKVAQSCLTFSDPMDCSPSGFSVHGIFQARVLEWGAIAFCLRVTERTSFNFIDAGHKFSWLLVSIMKVFGNLCFFVHFHKNAKPIYIVFFFNISYLSSL